MTLRDRVSMAFMKRVVATPEGRAHILRELADAEGNGENGFFENVLAQVDDPALAQMIRKHKEDELRHESSTTTRRITFYSCKPSRSVPWCSSNCSSRCSPRSIR